MSFIDEITNPKFAHRWIEQGSDEWDRIRIGRFTASEIHRLMTQPKSNANKEAGKLSETALSYVHEKVAEIMTGQCKQQGYAFPLVWGKEKEAEAIEHFKELAGLDVERVGFFPFTDHAGGSPDGLVGDDWILEIKCPYDSAKQVEYLMLNDQYDLKRFSKEYYWQCQANMLFTERANCYFATYDPRMVVKEHRMKVIEMKANNDDQNLILENLEKGVKEKLELLSMLRK